MVGEVEDRPFEFCQDVDIWRFGGECNGRGGQGGSPIESGAAEACSKKEMSDGFQTAIVS